MPRKGTDFFQHVAVFADDDSLVTALLAVNHGVHVHDTGIFAFRKAADFHRHAVRHFLVKTQ